MPSKRSPRCWRTSATAPSWLTADPVILIGCWPSAAFLRWACRLGTGSMRRRSNWVEATAAAERRWRTAASCWRLPEMITSQPEPTMSFDLTRQHFSGEVRRLRDSRFHDQIVELHLHRVLRIFVGFGQESDGASSQRIF